MFWGEQLQKQSMTYFRLTFHREPGIAGDAGSRTYPVRRARPRRGAFGEVW